jgi:hypothetical protein
MLRKLGVSLAALPFIMTMTAPRANAAASCPSGQTKCSNGCKSLQTDARNCGKCGSARATGATCAAGVCQEIVDSAYNRTRGPVEVEAILVHTVFQEARACPLQPRFSFTIFGLRQ